MNDVLDLNLRIENHSSDINNVLQINKEQLALLSNNPDFSVLVGKFEGLIKQFGYQFDLNVNMLGNKDIYLVLNALASALIPAGELHDFVWNTEGYNIGRLLNILPFADIDEVIRRMHNYLTNKDLLGADQAWDQEFAVENKKHIARILWHIRNTIRTYDEEEKAISLGTAVEGQVTKDEKINDIIEKVNQVIEFRIFRNFSSEAFRDPENPDGLLQILEGINLVSTTAMGMLEEVLPGEANKLRRLQILEVALDNYADRFNEQLENLFLLLIENGEFVVDLGIQGVGKGTIADSGRILREIIANGSAAININVGKITKQVSGINIFRDSLLALPEEIKTILIDKFGSIGKGDVYSTERATGTGAMYNPNKPNPDKRSIYDVYHGKVAFAGQFVGAGLMLGDKLTHMMVMIENCLAALDARKNKSKTLKIQWDVYPRTAGQVELMKALVEKMGDRGLLDMSNFFGFEVETLRKHLNDEESKKKSRSAALAWGVAEGAMKKVDSPIRIALDEVDAYANIYDLIFGEITEYPTIINELRTRTDAKSKYEYLNSDDVRSNHNFWEAVKVAILENNELIAATVNSGLLNEQIQTALQKELSQPKYAGNNEMFIGNVEEILNFIRDYVCQTFRSMDLIAGRIVELFRYDDTDFYSTIGRMASNDRDSLPGLFNELDHYAVGYEGGEAFAQYVEQMIGKNVAGFDINDENWLRFRAMLAKIHQDINLGKESEVDFEVEA